MVIRNDDDTDNSDQDRILRMALTGPTAAAEDSSDDESSPSRRLQRVRADTYVLSEANLKSHAQQSSAGALRVGPDGRHLRRNNTQLSDRSLEERMLRTVKAAPDVAKASPQRALRLTGDSSGPVEERNLQAGNGRSHSQFSSSTMAQGDKHRVAISMYHTPRRHRTTSTDSSADGSAQPARLERAASAPHANLDRERERSATSQHGDTPQSSPQSGAFQALPGVDSAEELTVLIHATNASASNLDPDGDGPPSSVTLSGPVTVKSLGGTESAPVAALPAAAAETGSPSASASSAAKPSSSAIANG